MTAQRLFLLLALTAIGAVRLSAQGDVDRRIRIDAAASIRIMHLAEGSVRVVGWDRDLLEVSGTVADTGAFYAGGGGSGAKIGIEQTGVTAPSHLEVRVPRRARVWIKTETASIEVSGVERGLDLFSVGGSIRVSGNPQQVYAESMDGAIEVDATAPWVRVKTASGPITLRGVGDDVAATTVSGKMEVRGGAFARARFESVTGDIGFEGDFDRGGSIDFESHTGRIELVVPPRIDADFEITSYQGKIENQLTADAPRASQRGRGTELMLRTGRGGAFVTVRSFKGVVRLLPKLT